MTFNRQFNSKYKGSKGIPMDPKSQTVPDMAKTIPELLENHARGLGLHTSERHGEYFDDVEIPVFDDITDRIAYKEELIQRTKEVDNQIKEERKQARKAKLEADRLRIEKQEVNPSETPKPSQNTPKPPENPD